MKGKPKSEDHQNKLRSMRRGPDGRYVLPNQRRGPDPVDLNRSCQCIKTCGTCAPCPNEISQEDLLCDECRAGCFCHRSMADRDRSPSGGTTTLDDYQPGPSIEELIKRYTNPDFSSGLIQWGRKWKEIDGLGGPAMDVAEGRLEVPPDQPPSED